MKAYVATTGITFGLLTAAHIWRAVVEPQLASEVFFIVATVLAAGFGLWALRLLWLKPQT